MDPDSELREDILRTLTHKATLKQRVTDNTSVTFNDLKEALHEFAAEIDDELDEKIDKRIRIEYRDRGKFEAQIQVADDVLIFSMHTDVFRFHDQHPVWENSYAGEDRDNGYCGMISIFNFLSDSFKYNRSEDEGYLIGRIFINHQMQYFVEGKFQPSQTADKFGTAQIDRSSLIGLIERTVRYVLDFDLLVPPFEATKKVCIEQFNTRNENSKLKTGKLLGLEYICDDI